jgi:phage terminase large subunit-like protein
MGGNILMREWWRCWPHGTDKMTEEQQANPKGTSFPENLSACFLAYDTAFSDDEEADYSAMSAWYAFERQTTIMNRSRGEEVRQQNLLLAGAWRAKVDAVDLIDHVEQHIRHFRPDFLLVEKRASGIQLIQELRRRRPRWVDQNKVVHYPVIYEWLPPFPPKASGKRPRAYAAATVLAEGSVWFMPHSPNSAIAQLLRECTVFPGGAHDDLCDTVTMAMIHSRNVKLLEMELDVLDSMEEDQADFEMADRLRNGRGSYGRIESQNPKSSFKRKLYGSA